MGCKVSAYWDVGQFSGKFLVADPNPDDPQLQQILVMNTHFDHVGVAARVESARFCVQKVLPPQSSQIQLSLFSKLKEIAAAEDDLVLLMGDFNCEPGSDPYKVLTATKTEGDDLVLLDTQHNPATTRASTKCGWSNDQSGVIDYIFVGNRYAATFSPKSL